MTRLTEEEGADNERGPGNSDRQRSVTEEQLAELVAKIVETGSKPVYFEDIGRFPGILPPIEPKPIVNTTLSRRVRRNRDR